MRRILLLAGAIVLVDTLFFAALTPLLPHYAHRLGLGKAGAGLLAAAYPLGALAGSIPSGIVAARLGTLPATRYCIGCAADRDAVESVAHNTTRGITSVTARARH